MPSPEACIYFSSQWLGVIAYNILCLSGPSLGMEALSYCFKLPDPSPADSYVGVHFTSALTEIEANCIGNTDW